MHRILAAFCFSGLFLFSAPTASSAPQSKTIRMSIPILGDHFQENGTGRSYAAIQAVYNHCGTKVVMKSHLWPLHWQAYEDDKSVDAAAIVWDSAGLEGFKSDPYIFSKNGVVSLASKKLKITSLADMKGLRVTGFTGASTLFPEILTHYRSFKSYMEAPSGNAAYQRLLLDTTDTFVTDQLIFIRDYMVTINKAGGTYGSETWPAMTFHEILPAIGDVIYFKKQEDRDHFNTCLASASEKGLLKEALKPFLMKYNFFLKLY